MRSLQEGFTEGTPLLNQIKARKLSAREKLEQGIKKLTDAREEEIRAAEEAAKEVEREQERQAERLAEELRQPFDNGCTRTSKTSSPILLKASSKAP